MSPGTLLADGKYSIGKVLGRGGFGITYLGADLRLGRATAVKEFFLAGSVRTNGTVIPLSTLRPAEYAAAQSRFEQEARVLARFHHPAIVAVHDVFRDNGTAYMVMEYVSGSTLAQLLDQRGTPLGEEELLEIASPVSEALDLIHAAGLLHRDIKPDNIMRVSRSGGRRTVLVDFGAAREFARGQTIRQSVVLTRGYAPLEQYAEQARRGPPTDIYSLAATLYHLATGAPPPSAPDRVTGVTLKPPDHLNSSLTHVFSQALLHALQIKIDERPVSAGLFFAELIGSHRGSLDSGRLPFASNTIPLLSSVVARANAAAPSVRMPESSDTQGSHVRANQRPDLSGFCLDGRHKHCQGGAWSGTPCACACQ